MIQQHPGYRHPRLNAGFAIVTLLVAAACSDRAPDKAATPSGNGAASVSVQADPVPPAVTQVGHHSENIYDMAKISDWLAARASTDSLRSAVELLPVSDAHAGAIRALSDTVSATADTLDRAVTSRDKRGAMRSANRLTQLGAMMAAPYSPRTPAGVTLLDFYGRELEFWAAMPSGPAEAHLSETASAVRRTWDGIRPQVIARGGSSEAASFDSLVSRVMTAKTRTQYAGLATPVLDKVDFLERVFTR